MAADQLQLKVDKVYIEAIAIASWRMRPCWKR